MQRDHRFRHGDQSLAGAAQTIPSVTFRVDYVQSNYSRRQVEGVIRTLLEGVVLTAILMVLFLQVMAQCGGRDDCDSYLALRGALAMKIFNFSLDTISLLAMTLVIGVLIDDSTVVLENVARHHETAKSRSKRRSTAAARSARRPS